MKSLVDKILVFWFGRVRGCTAFEEIPADRFKFWFGGGREVDESIATAFKPDLLEISQSPHRQAQLKENPEALMAAIILFDQFPRNIFRSSAEAFAYDPLARELAQTLLDRNWDQQINPIWRLFAYLPFEHSESLAHQQLSCQLFQALLDDVSSSAMPASYTQFCQQSLSYALKHLEIIQKFGRFPHRNAVLGRPSTALEIEYLGNGGETFAPK